MNKEFVIADVLPGKLNALVKNLMEQMQITDANEAVRRINSGEWKVSEPAKRWREVDGVIYFTVTSDGTTGEQWIKRLEKKGFRVEPTYVKEILLSKDFKPTKGVTYEIAVLKGWLFSDNDCITQKIRDKATEMKLMTPNAEVACLIREMFSDKELEAMGLLWIVTMHEPIVSVSFPSLLGANRGNGGRWLVANDNMPGRCWYRGGGFAFVVPQVS